MSETEAPRPGEFCDRHFSWLCQAGQGECQADATPADLLRAPETEGETP